MTEECVRCALLLLCGLGVALPAQFGRCAGDLCFFQDSLEFDGAKRACETTAGSLFSTHSGELKDLGSVLDSLHDEVWIQSRDSTGVSAGGVRLCTVASLARNRSVWLRWESCDDKLSGFVCQYGVDDMCDGLEPTGGALLRYATTTGFILNSTDTFPPGTIAVEQRIGRDYPDSRRLCFSRNWLQAPWSCEVLNGGCEHNCDMDSKTCVCPEDSSVYSNGISCVPEPRVQPQCPPGGCKCAPGFTQGPGGRGCVDLDECEVANLCPGVHNECVNTPGSYMCMCLDGFDWEDGECVNVTICSLCEHMDCQKYDGVYRCACRKGFMVSPVDPTKCVWNCTERDCPAICDANYGPQCFCQEGYVIDIANDTRRFCTDINECEVQMMCDHRCENLFGSYRCLCEEGFDLVGEYKCVKSEDEGEEEASGSEFPTQSTVTAAGLQPAALPSYIKTGSILGITVFMLLCVVLLALLTRNAVKRCGKFELSTFKHPDLDIYYLQQVSTETYKRLSLDRQLKNDSQRL